MEFVEYLLDGLKEDCNRIKGRKVYVERADANGRPDRTVAQEAASNFLLRCDSDIDDMFVGFFRSMLTCPEMECGHKSVAFDPFLSVKVPIMSPEKTRFRAIEVTIVPLARSGALIEQVRVSVPSNNSAEARRAAFDLSEVSFFIPSLSLLDASIFESKMLHAVREKTIANDEMRKHTLINSLKKKLTFTETSRIKIQPRSC
jgi:hypothetical protein